MSAKEYFITATDTDAGKTFIAQALLMDARLRGLRSAAYKPISAGCERTGEGLRNEDALALQRHASIKLAYQQVNPVAFEDPVAPHLAAEKQATQINMPLVQQGLDELRALDADLLLVEGAGGWRLPISDTAYLSDFVVDNQLPVILVVGMKLGCLNHAVLTAQAIKNDGVTLAGWVANQVDPEMAYRQENVASLQRLLDVPFLGHVPHVGDPQAAIPHLQLDQLIG